MDNRQSNAVRLADTPEFIRLNFECFCRAVKEIGIQTGFDPAVLDLPDSEMIKFSPVLKWVTDYIPMALQLIAPRQKNDLKNRCSFIMAFQQAHTAALGRWIEAACSLELPEDKEFEKLMQDNGVTKEMLKRVRPDEKYVALAQEYGILDYLLAEAGIKQ